MSKIPLNKVRLGLLMLIGLLAAAIVPATVIGRGKVGPLQQAATVVCATGTTFDLITRNGFIQTPDGNSVYMWGYSIMDAGVNTNFQIPGPVLCVDQGDSITVNLYNTLPDPVSVVFPGQTGVTGSGGSQGLFAVEVAGCADPCATPTGPVSYNFVAAEPGTYLYESGTDTYKQIHMGLYGAIIVRPDGHSDWAYNDESTKFAPDKEYLLLMHEVDPDLHKAVELGEDFDITTKHDRYWFINGRSFPDIADPSGAPWFPHQPYGALVRVEAYDPDGCGSGTLPDCPDPALIRYANAGLENHPFHPHGNNMKVIGRDGRKLDASFDNFNTTVGSGQTYDLLFEWKDVEAWRPNKEPYQTAGTVKPIPETIPGLLPQILNLVWKDDATFYSGSAYLGEQGDFPPGVVVDNECGEFYFPWHSHALNEVQNFDEGFGGMLTIVRVDPPGGCQ